MEKTGWYADSWVQYGWFDNTVKGEGLSAESYRSRGLSASLEGGYTLKAGRYATYTGRENAVYVRPQGQVMWSGMKADSHRERNGTRVEGRGDGNVTTRLGVRVSVQSQSGHDRDTGRVFEPYAEVNWLHNSRNYGVAMGSEVTNARGQRDVGEVKLGVEGKVGERVGLWGSVSQQAGSQQYRDTQGVLGVKVSF